MIAILPPINPSNLSMRLFLYSDKWNRYIPVVKMLLHQLIHTTNMQVGDYYHPCLYHEGKGSFHRALGIFLKLVSHELSLRKEAPP